MTLAVNWTLYIKNQSMQWDIRVKGHEVKCIASVLVTFTSCEVLGTFSRDEGTSVFFFSLFPFKGVLREQRGEVGSTRARKRHSLQHELLLSVQ